MGYDGPQVNCSGCGWSNFTIRYRCRHCGISLPHNEVRPAQTRTSVSAGSHPAKAPIADPAFRRIVHMPIE